jgi:hypothetical protein
VIALERLGGLMIPVPVERIRPEHDLSLSEGSIARPERTLPLPEPEESRRDDDQTSALRRVLEALRFGIVPATHLEELTLGLPQLRRWIKDHLPNVNGKPQSSEVSGPFGTGKSHTMAVVRTIARKEGYLTAHVEVDGTSVTLADPGSLVHQLCLTVEGGGLESPTPILDLYLRAHQRNDSIAIRELTPFERILSNYSTIVHLKQKGVLDHYGDYLDAIASGDNSVTASDLRGLLLREVYPGSAWYEERSIRPKRMVGNQVADRPRDFMECLLGYARLANLAGFRGWVITVDEFEVEHLRSPNFERVKSVIDGMVHSMRGPTTAPLGLFFATADQEGHTGDAVIEALVEVTGGGHHELAQWPKNDRRHLAEKIHRLYVTAYGSGKRFDRQTVDHVEEGLAQSDVHGSGLIRAFIKAYLSHLDATLGPPHAA